MSYISAITKDDQVIVWERTDKGREERYYDAPYYFYIEEPTGKFESIYGDKLTKIKCKNRVEFYSKRKHYVEEERIKVWEGDIQPEIRILSSEYYNKPAPKLNITFFDIEVNYDPQIGFASPDNPYAPINSIALVHEWNNRLVVLTTPPTPDWTSERLLEEVKNVSHEAPLSEEYQTEIVVCADEKELLAHFLLEIEDSDVISGWNSDLFDIPYVGKRVELQFGKKSIKRLDFRGCEPAWREVLSATLKDKQGNRKRLGITLDLRGRIKADYMDLYKKYEPSEKPSYKLASIEQEVGLNLPKLEYEGSLHNLYKNNYPFFIRYNIRDCEILHGFEKKLKYVELSNQLYHLSCGTFNHVTGTLRLAEYAIINYAHHVLKKVVPSVVPPEIDRQIEGALVLTPKAGMHQWIGSIDINSLYPSSIRSLNISPETLVGQFLEETKASQAIAANSEQPLSLQLESGELITKPANIWREICIEKKWAVSGYGTIFDQNKQGIIPSVLADWYSLRKKYQALKKEADNNHDAELSDYYDRLQYVYKIKLNSLYGALSNINFRFYDLRMGESTTGTGRAILQHQCSKVNELLEGNYEIGNAVIYGDSVSGSSLIYTDKGTFKIEDLFVKTNRSLPNGKEYCDIHNINTLTYNPETKQNEFRKLKYVMRHKVKKSMYRVWYGNTRYVDVTEDHSLIGYANTKHKTPGLVEVKPTDIGKNNINGILLNRQIPRKNISSPSNISIEMFELMGLIVGDGYVEKSINSGIDLSLGKMDKQEIINKTINPLIEQGWLTSVVHMKNNHDVRLCGTKAWYFLREHLYKDNIKIIPEWLYDCNEEHICAFLRGYFTADGFANKNKTIGLCSTNSEFIIQTNNLLKFCGIPSNYWIETTENSFKGKYSGTHTIRLTIYDCVMFGKKIGFLLERKNKNIRVKYSKPTQHLTTQSGFCIIHPTKIEQIETPEYVYDIEVDHTHTFYANDILVHNTDSTYFKTYANSKEEAIKIADAVAAKVNSSYNEFMRNTFLCTEGYDNIIKAGRELVSDNGIFVDKKRYILHVVDKEGKPSDSMKVMGLETKKTTLPKHVADTLNKFVEDYLKGVSWEIIARQIVDYKKQLQTEKNIMLIGLPKGIQGIENYTEDYKNLGENARLPGHVAAAIHYNECLKKFNDKESLEIISGMKIKVFYLNKMYGKFKSIALPTDLEVIPTWFFDNYQIDIDAHIERLVDSPLENILKAVGKTSPSSHDLFIEDEFQF